MRNLGRKLGGMALLLAGAAAVGVPAVWAQVAYPAGPGGGVPFVVPALPVTPGQPGVAPAGTAANPLHVTGGGGSGGGTSGAPADASATVGTMSVQLLPAVGARQFLLVQNQSAGATVGVNFGQAATTGLGSVLLQPGATLLLQAPGFVPNTAVTAAASALGTPLTVKAY